MQAYRQPPAGLHSFNHIFCQQSLQAPQIRPESAPPSSADPQDPGNILRRQLAPSHGLNPPLPTRPARFATSWTGAHFEATGSLLHWSPYLHQLKTGTDASSPFHLDPVKLQSLRQHHPLACFPTLHPSITLGNTQRSGPPFDETTSLPARPLQPLRNNLFREWRALRNQFAPLRTSPRRSNKPRTRRPSHQSSRNFSPARFPRVHTAVRARSTTRFRQKPNRPLSFSTRRMTNQTRTESSHHQARHL